MAYHYDPKNITAPDIITKINIDPENPKKMTYIVKDVASGVELIQTLNKQWFFWISNCNVQDMNRKKNLSKISMIKTTSW